MQLILQSEQRVPLHDMLDRLVPVLEELKEVRKVRWPMDVDPVAMY